MTSKPNSGRGELPPSIARRGWLSCQLCKILELVVLQIQMGGRGLHVAGEVGGKEKDTGKGFG